MLKDEEDIEEYLWFMRRVKEGMRKRKLRPAHWGPCQMCHLVGYQCHPCTLRVNSMWEPARGEDPDYDSDEDC